MAKNKKKMIKVIALDLDGTLLRSDKKVSIRTMNVLNSYAENGYKIVIATGRSPQFVSKILPELQSDTHICYSGAVIYENGNKVYEKLISPRSILEIICWFELNYPDLIVVIDMDGELYSNKVIEGLSNYKVVDLKKICHKSAARIIIKVQEASDINLVYENLPSDCRMILTDHGTYAEIFSTIVSKAEALKYMLERWNLSFDNVIAFGDDLNDIEILKESKIGVAMGNAHLEVKRIANAIAKSNDEEGIAEYLEQRCI